MPVTPKTAAPKPGKPEKPKSPEAGRAVMKPEKVKAAPETDESTWKGGVDRFSERV